MASPEKLTVTVSSKGRITVPKSIRDRLNWSAGARLVVEDTTDGVILKTAAVFALTRPEDVFASLGYGGVPKRLAEMNKGIAAEVKRRHGRNRY